MLNRLISLAFIGISLLILCLSLRLGIGEVENPGPGFLPLLASIILFSLSVLVFVLDIKGHEKNEKSEGKIFRNRFPKPMAFVTALVVYTSLLGQLGYLITTFMLMVVMFSLTSPKKTFQNILVSAMLVILSYLIFSRWLRVQLPVGLFSF